MRNVSNVISWLAGTSLLMACAGTPTDTRDPGPVNPPSGPVTPPPAPPPPPKSDPTWDPATTALPRLIEAHYLPIDRIAAISRFRSGIGHDYSDDFERCRSMKHYMRPTGNGSDWGTVPVHAPVTGRVTRVLAEWVGTQLQIRSSANPAFTVILFHVAVSRPFAEGDSVSAGEIIGTHVGGMTTSDVAVLAMTPRGRAFVSYIETLPETLFASIAARGVARREEFIIPAAERDAKPLVCDGETFIGADPLVSWVTLGDAG